MVRWENTPKKPALNPHHGPWREQIRKQPAGRSCLILLAGLMVSLAIVAVTSPAEAANCVTKQHDSEDGPVTFTKIDQPIIVDGTVGYTYCTYPDSHPTSEPHFVAIHWKTKDGKKAQCGSTAIPLFVGWNSIKSNVHFVDNFGHQETFTNPAVQCVNLVQDTQLFVMNAVKYGSTPTSKPQWTLNLNLNIDGVKDPLHREVHGRLGA